MFATFPIGRQALFALLFVWLASALLRRHQPETRLGPHDEGTLGQAAERVLQREMPHRDFEDPYTGGLSYLDALVFRLLGPNLIGLRFPLFIL